MISEHIQAAWDILNMPELEQMQIVFEHGDWWVSGWDIEDDMRVYAVVEATGPGSTNGIAFEEC